MRSLHHATYVFEKRLSHTADSQDQRHRMVPASRPLMTFTDTAGPDYITPRLIAANPRAKAVYDEAMREAWDRQEPAAGARCAARVRALRAAQRQDAALRGVGLAARRCCTSGRCAPASTRRKRSFWPRWTKCEQVRAAHPRIGRSHRSAVRGAQRADLAALHRGDALLRRAGLA